MKRAHPRISSLDFAACPFLTLRGRGPKNSVLPIVGNDATRRDLTKSMKRKIHEITPPPRGQNFLFPADLSRTNLSIDRPSSFSKSISVSIRWQYLFMAWQAASGDSEIHTNRPTCIRLSLMIRKKREWKKNLHGHAYFHKCLSRAFFTVSPLES